MANPADLYGACCYLENHPVLRGGYTPVKPEDIDYAISPAWNQFYQETLFGKLSTETKPTQPKQPIEQAQPIINQRGLERLQGDLYSLRDFVKQHVNESTPRRPRGQY